MENRTGTLIRFWKRTTYLVEAKQVYVSLSNRANNSSGKIEEALKQAKSDAVACRGESENRLGIVFIVPYIPPSEIKYASDRIEMFKDELNKLNYDLLAYYLQSKSSMRLTSDNYAYPGVVLIGKITRRK